MTSRQQIKRDINNLNVYKSMQIDLTKKSVKSEENINLNKQEAYALVIDGIYALDKAKKQYQTNLNHYEANCESKQEGGLQPEGPGVGVHPSRLLRAVCGHPGLRRGHHSLDPGKMNYARAFPAPPPPSSLCFLVRRSLGRLGTRRGQS